MSGFLTEFRAFISRGNIVDLAVAVVVGTAFTAITASLVDNILMPIIAVFTGGVDFSALGVVLRDGHLYATLAEAEAAGAPVLRYGLFLNAVVYFVIIALAMFLVVKGVTRLQSLRQREAAAEAPTPELAVLTEIRDLLAAERPPPS